MLRLFFFKKTLRLMFHVPLNFFLVFRTLLTTWSLLHVSCKHMISICPFSDGAHRNVLASIFCCPRATSYLGPKQRKKKTTKTTTSFFSDGAHRDDGRTDGRVRATNVHDRAGDRGRQVRQREGGGHLSFRL